MINAKYLEAIKRFEGFTPRAQWDYAQATNGYGTRAQFDGEIIDREEAERRFNAEIKRACDVVERFAPNLDEGAKAALTSLTFNAGPSWTTSGLGRAIQSGDFSSARSIFQKYDKACGQPLAGLTSRRSAEVAWFEDADIGSTNNPRALVAKDPAGTAMAAAWPPALVSAARNDPPKTQVIAVQQSADRVAVGVGAGVRYDLANILAMLALGSLYGLRHDETGRWPGSDRAANPASILG